MKIVPVLLLALSFVPTSAIADLPPPSNSTVPTLIRLVGHTGGVADDRTGAFSVTVRDLASNPIEGSRVVVDFAAASDLQLCPDAAHPGLVVNLVARTVSAFTDADGIARFTILGGSSGAAASERGTVRVFADGVLLTPTNNITGMVCAAPDLDGSGGVGANDIGQFLADFVTALPWQRSDLDGTGYVGANDLSQLLGILGDAGSTESCP